ncbi:hypothetical protein P872_22020 [Rhodonellum psychrophilum GCM71 = DSM 17998]|uniref:Uncharacterized protein n=1 Tax=Rhodonellum psychrophilum GCM71 = DSM 17998 TaxID=1123057 RepID=U5BR90_9BACT|nr:hypothetical protein P872_22020 [Rhodonellum psychrophilum GCM71 = DSM 17998]
MDDGDLFAVFFGEDYSRRLGEFFFGKVALLSDSG